MEAPNLEERATTIGMIIVTIIILVFITTHIVTKMGGISSYKRIEPIIRLHTNGVTVDTIFIYKKQNP